MMAEDPDETAALVDDGGPGESSIDQDGHCIEQVHVPRAPTHELVLRLLPLLRVGRPSPVDLRPNLGRYDRAGATPRMLDV
jgi:hypothetical protein